MDTRTKKRFLLFVIIGVLVAGAVFLTQAIIRNQRSLFIEKNIESFLESQKYKTETKNDWSDGAWLTTFNKDKIEHLYFETSYMGDATEAWVYDGIRFYYDEGSLHAVVGTRLRFNSSMKGLFKDLKNLKTITGLSHLNTENVEDMSELFSGCENLYDVKLNELDTSGVKNIDKMFYNCKTLKKIDLTRNSLLNCETANGIFVGCPKLEEISLPSLKNIQSMNQAFFEVGSFNFNTKLVAELDTINLTSAVSMFEKSNFVNIEPIENMKTNKLENATRMFFNSSYDNLDLSKWKTNNLKHTDGMFEDSMGLMQLNLNRWNASSLVTTSSMFKSCTSLTNLTLNWNNCGNLKSANQMFYLCDSLTELDLSFMNDHKIGDAREMFFCAKNIENIYCSKITTDISDDMFLGCESLTGSINYNSEQNRGNMADTNGYFSERKS